MSLFYYCPKLTKKFQNSVNNVLVTNRVIKPVSFNFLLFRCLIPILKSEQNAFISIIMYFTFAFIFEMWALKPGI